MRRLQLLKMQSCYVLPDTVTNNIPGDSNGHYYYIKEGNTIWNPGWMPTKTDLDSYECHHGIGYSIFKGSKMILPQS